MEHCRGLPQMATHVALSRGPLVGSPQLFGGTSSTAQNPQPSGFQAFSMPHVLPLGSMTPECGRSCAVRGPAADGAAASGATVATDASPGAATSDAGAVAAGAIVGATTAVAVPAG
jgi:hypothetical protein